MTDGRKSLKDVNFHYDRKKHRVSFYYAVRGIKFAFITQPNYRFHTFAFVVVMVVASYFRVTASDLAVLFLASGLVFVSEMVNTSLEALGDEIADGEILKLIGVAKDIASGAVLISAIVSVLVGLSVFLPYIARYL